jgi:hypothetical protein
MSSPGLSPGNQSVGDKQRALQQGLADKVVLFHAAIRALMAEVLPVPGGPYQMMILSYS